MTQRVQEIKIKKKKKIKENRKEVINITQVEIDPQPVDHFSTRHTTFTEIRKKSQRKKDPNFSNDPLQENSCFSISAINSKEDSRGKRHVRFKSPNLSAASPSSDARYS